MKKLRLLSLVGITWIAVSQAGWAAPHGGGGGGFHGGGFGGGHFGGGGRGGGVAHFGGGGARFSAFRAGPAYRQPIYSRQASRSISPSVRSATAFGRNTNQSGSTARQRATVSGARASASSSRQAFNSRSHVFARHDGNWHRGWDRHHSHYWRNHWWFYDDGYWLGYDDGFYPYDYYAYGDNPYDDQDNYGYNAATDPYSVSTVSAVQSELAEQGYYRGAVDGVYGPQTRAALSNYQSDHNLQVTGSLTAATLQALGLEQATSS